MVNVQSKSGIGRGYPLRYIIEVNYSWFLYFQYFFSYMIFVLILCCSQGKVPFGLRAGRRLVVDRFDDHTNRVHKRGFTHPFPPKTVRRRETIDGFDRLRRQLVHVSRERVVHRSRQNHRHGFRFRVHVDNFCHQKRWHHCWRPTHFGKLRPCSCVLRVSVYRAYWKMLGDRGVCGLGCCLEPKLQGMTSQCVGIGLISCQTYRSIRYRVGVVPMLPKCLVPVSMLYRYRYRLRYIRAYRNRRYRY